MPTQKMKEKCKDAARIRREKERAEFINLGELLPLPTTSVSQLDKASIIRLTSSFLSMRSAFQYVSANCLSKTSKSQLNDEFHENINNMNVNHYINDNNSLFFEQQSGPLLIEALEGFVFALQRDAKIMYISEGASIHLGLAQINLTGSNIMDFAHPSDHDDLKQLLNISDSDRHDLIRYDQMGIRNCKLPRSFTIRMRCTLPKRNAGLVVGCFKVIQCVGYLLTRIKEPDEEYLYEYTYRDLQPSFDCDLCNYSRPIYNQQRSTFGQHSELRLRQWEPYALVALGSSLLPFGLTEIKLNNHSFMMRLNLDLKFTYIENIGLNTLRFSMSECLGRSLYQFVHPEDLSIIYDAHKNILEKGQSIMRSLRLIRKDNVPIWVQFGASSVASPRSNMKIQHIVCVCSIIGEDFTYLNNQLRPQCNLDSESGCEFCSFFTFC